MERKDYELRDLIDERIDIKIKEYDERLWEKIKAFIAEHISPKFQTLFMGYSLGKWIAGVVGLLAIGTIWQIITTVGKSLGGG